MTYHLSSKYSAQLHKQTFTFFTHKYFELQITCNKYSTMPYKHKNKIY